MTNLDIALACIAVIVIVAIAFGAVAGVISLMERKRK